ncbi:karyopherin [Batrachochytrium dendrobatidis]|nr:karyopherin [Batrachochytrium dendrobatidis]
MDSALLNGVVQALNTVYSNTSSNEDRKLSDKYLEGIRDMPEAPFLGLHLAYATSQLPSHVRHFGLGLIESVIKYKWKSSTYSDDQREIIKSSIFQLCDSGLGNNIQETRLITEKLAKIFVELAKRTWPLEWTSMDVQLRALYQKHMGGRILVLLFYKSLAEDVFIFEDDVVTSRKKELSTALMSVTVGTGILHNMLSKPIDPSQTGVSNRQDLQLLMQLIVADPDNEGWFTRWSTAIETLACAMTSKSENHAQSDAERLLVLTLNCLAVFLDWVLLESVIETRTLYRLLQLHTVQSNSVRLASADCLTVLFSRNIRPLDPIRMTCLWQPLFADGQLDLIVAAWIGVYAPYSSLNIEQAQQDVFIPECDYIYLKRLAHAIASLGNYQICFRKNTVCPQRFEEYMQLILLMISHPSLIVSGHAVSFLLEAIKHDFIRVSCLQPYILLILDKFLFKLLSRSAMSNKSLPGYRYAAIDFDTDFEIDHASMGSTQRMTDAIRLIPPILPDKVFEWLRAKCTSMLNSPTISSSECQAISTMTDCIMSGIPSESVRGSDINQIELAKSIMLLLVQLIDYNGNQNMAIVIYQLQMIVAFSEYMDLYPEILLKCLEKFFGFVVYTQPNEKDFIQQQKILSESTRNLRRKAAASLVRIGSTMPNLLQPLLPQIMPLVSNYIQSSQLMRIEQTLMIEFLVAIICGSSMEIHSKSSMLQDVLAWDLAHFKSFEPYSVFDVQFFDSIGVNTLVQMERELKATKSPVGKAHDMLGAATSLRNSWSASFNAIWNYLKRIRHSQLNKISDGSAGAPIAVSNVWPEIVVHILPQILATIKCIHESWSPKVLSTLPPDFAQLRLLTKTERAMLLGSYFAEKDHEDTSVLDPESAFEDHLKRICGWFGRMREISYQLLATLSTMGTDFYLIQNLPDTIISSQVLLPILPVFFQIVVKKLIDLWRDHLVTSTEDQVSDSIHHYCDDEENNDESEEILADRLLRDVTRVYADLWFAILMPFAEKNPKRKVEGGSITAGQVDHPSSPAKLVFQNTNLVMFFFANESLVRSFLGTMSLLMGVKDTFACKRSLAMCMTLTSHLVKDTAFHEMVGKDFLVSALEVLHDGYQQVNHSDAIGLITEIYMQLHSVSRIPFNTMASIPGMTIDVLQRFEEELTSKRTVKEQHVVVRTMLKSVTGVELSERFKKATIFVLNLSEKNMFAAVKSDTHHADIIEKETIEPVLSTFFDRHEQ